MRAGTFCKDNGILAYWGLFWVPLISENDHTGPGGAGEGEQFCGQETSLGLRNLEP